MRRRDKYIIWMLLGLLLSLGNSVFAQRIGGQFGPLQYSVHTYSIVMGDAAYEPLWNIYVALTDESQIEDNVAVAATGFQVLGNYKTGNIAYFTVQFAIGITPMAENDYVIGYKETTNDGKLCVKAVVKDIHLYGSFDVDVELNTGEIALNCADETGDFKVDDLATFSTIEYKVFVKFPTDDPGYIDTGGDNKWSFLFTVKTEGISGDNASIESIAVASEAPDVLAPIPTYDLSAKPSEFNGACNVSPSSVTPVIFTVVYNDKPGVSQNITFQIKTIFGAYEEPDIDEVNNTLVNNNIVSHTIYALPDAKAIAAWN